ncbi:MAG TPA: DUF2892 domain-containing protein [Thermoanaerobaculia bacterium]|nr:DUF2892 domain-containing protein [Thermoanaerobaculia bacterium]
MAVSFRDKLGSMGNRSNVNVGKMERWASVLGGAALAAYALKRRSKGSMGLAALGAPLLWRGATGHCSVYERLGIDRTSGLQQSGLQQAGDSYDQARTKPLTDIEGTEGRPVVTTDRQPIGQNF